LRSSEKTKLKKKTLFAVVGNEVKNILFAVACSEEEKSFLVVVGNSSTPPIHYSNNGRFKRQQKVL
jgi:hypothetical protein